MLAFSNLAHIITNPTPQRMLPNIQDRIRDPRPHDPTPRVFAEPYAEDQDAEPMEELEAKHVSVVRFNDRMAYGYGQLFNPIFAYNVALEPVPAESDLIIHYHWTHELKMSPEWGDAERMSVLQRRTAPGPSIRNRMPLFPFADPEPLFAGSRSAVITSPFIAGNPHEDHLVQDGLWITMHVKLQKPILSFDPRDNRLPQAHTDSGRYVVPSAITPPSVRDTATHIRGIRASFPRFVARVMHFARIHETMPHQLIMGTVNIPPAMGGSKAAFATSLPPLHTRLPAVCRHFCAAMRAVFISSIPMLLRQWDTPVNRGIYKKIKELEREERCATYLRFCDRTSMMMSQDPDFSQTISHAVALGPQDVHMPGHLFIESACATFCELRKMLSTHASNKNMWAANHYHVEIRSGDNVVHRIFNNIPLSWKLTAHADRDMPFMDVFSPISPDTPPTLLHAITLFDTWMHHWGMRGVDLEFLYSNFRPTAGDTHAVLLRDFRPMLYIAARTANVHISIIPAKEVDISTDEALPNLAYAVAVQHFADAPTDTWQQDLQWCLKTWAAHHVDAIATFWLLNSLRNGGLEPADVWPTLLQAYVSERWVPDILLDSGELQIPEHRSMPEAEPVAPRAPKRATRRRNPKPKPKPKRKNKRKQKKESSSSSEQRGGNGRRNIVYASGRGGAPSMVAPSIMYAAKGGALLNMGPEPEEVSLEDLEIEEMMDAVFTPVPEGSGGDGGSSAWADSDAVPSDHEFMHAFDSIPENAVYTPPAAGDKDAQAYLPGMKVPDVGPPRLEPLEQRVGYGARDRLNQNTCKTCDQYIPVGQTIPDFHIQDAPVITF